MNKMLRKLGAGTVLLLVTATVVAAKDWRGIVPLKSTRADVERVFGVSHQAPTPLRYVYKLPNEIVVFHFKYQTCEDGEGRVGLGWKVPIGTVVEIGVIPKGKHRKEEYLTRNAKVEDHGAGFVYYSDHSAGLSLETYQNQVTLVEYFPRASQNSLRCPKIDTCCVDFFHKFDEYAELPFEDEKARLDNYRFQVVALDGRAIIEVVGPSRARQERLKRAARSKEYLLSLSGLETERILLVDGGYAERVTTRLYIYSTGGPGSRVYLELRKDP